MPEYYEGENGFGNLALPNVYAADDATALYPRGTKLVQGERIFYYGTYRGVVNPGASAATVTATNGDDLAFKVLFSVAYNQDMATGLLVRKIANELHIAYQTTVDDGARADNWYSGGYVSGKDSTPADERMFSRRIVKHEYAATGSKTQNFWNTANEANTVVDLSSYSEVSVLELDQPVINSKTTMATVIHQNPWKHAIWQNSTAYIANHAILGACMHNDPTATRAVWMQTYGPMFAPHYHAGTGVGTADNEGTVVVMADGSYQARGTTYDYFATGAFFPVIGYVLGSAIFELATRTAELLPMIYLTIRR